MMLLVFPHASAATRTPPQSAQTQIERWIAASPHLRQGHIGFEFADADTGELLAAQGADQFFTPASNTKLYTTSLALECLGVNYQFKTSVRTTAELKPGQSRDTGCDIDRRRRSQFVRTHSAILTGRPRQRSARLRSMDLPIRSRNGESAA